MVKRRGVNQLQRWNGLVIEGILACVFSFDEIRSRRTMRNMVDEISKGGFLISIKPIGGVHMSSFSSILKNVIIVKEENDARE